MSQPGSTSQNFNQLFQFMHKEPRENRDMTRDNVQFPIVGVGLHKHESKKKSVFLS